MIVRGLRELGFGADLLDGPSFLPTDLPNLLGWWKGDGVLWQNSGRTTPVASDGDPVGAWDDGSGNGRHLIQATAAARPTFRSAGVNGRPTVEYDNVDDSLRFDTAVNLAKNYTYFACAKITDWAAARVFFIGVVVANSLMWSANSSAENRHSAPPDAVTVADTLPSADTIIVAVRRTGSTVRFYRDGAQKGSDQTLATNADWNDSFAIGGLFGQGPYGHMCESFLYGDSKSDADVDKAVAYMNSKWAAF